MYCFLTFVWEWSGQLILKLIFVTSLPSMLWHYVDTSFKRDKWSQTKRNTTFSDIVFHALAISVVCFVPTDSSRNSEPETVRWSNIFFGIFVFLNAYSQNKTNHKTGMGMWNWAIKSCLFLCSILFEVTYAFRMMWGDIWIPKWKGPSNKMEHKNKHLFSGVFHALSRGGVCFYPTVVF